MMPCESACIVQTEEVVEKDLMIQEKNKLYEELKNILARQPGPEVRLLCEFLHLALGQWNLISFSVFVGCGAAEFVTAELAGENASNEGHGLRIEHVSGGFVAAAVGTDGSGL